MDAAITTVEKTKNAVHIVNRGDRPLASKYPVFGLIFIMFGTVVDKIAINVR